MKNTNRKIMIASFFASLLILVPFSTIASDPTSILDEASIEEPDTESTDINPTNQEQTIEMLQMALEKISLECSDNPEILHVISMIYQKLSIFKGNEEGATEELPSLCYLLILLIALRVGTLLYMKLTQVWAYINGFGSIEIFIIEMMRTFQTLIGLMLLCKVYLELCTDDTGGSATTLQLLGSSGFLNIEGIYTYDITFDCGCSESQGSPTYS